MATKGKLDLTEFSAELTNQQKDDLNNLIQLKGIDINLVKEEVQEEDEGMKKEEDEGMKEEDEEMKKEEDEEMKEEDECQHCFCTPCITTHHGPQQDCAEEPSDNNESIRRQHYFNYWKELKKLGKFEDPRYKARKRKRVLKDTKIYSDRIPHWKREINPECVLAKVRGLFPAKHPDDYTGHKWVTDGDLQKKKNPVTEESHEYSIEMTESQKQDLEEAMQEKWEGFQFVNFNQTESIHDNEGPRDRKRNYSGQGPECESCWCAPCITKTATITDGSIEHVLRQYWQELKRKDAFSDERYRKKLKLVDEELEANPEYEKNDYGTTSRIRVHSRVDITPTCVLRKVDPEALAENVKYRHHPRFNEIYESLLEGSD